MPLENGKIFPDHVTLPTDFLVLKEESKNKKYSGLLINYLKNQGNWDNNKNTYCFGDNNTEVFKTNTKSFTLEQQRFISNSKEDLNIN